MPEYLVLGNSAGGVAAAEAIRSVDRDGSLAVVSDDPYPAYSRPLISKYLAGETSEEAMLFRSPDFYREHNIHTHLGHKAVRLDLEARVAELEDGQTIPWQRLLLATGGSPIIPKMEGLDRDGVFTFTTLGDARRLEAALEPGGQVVVVGGGLIGMSVTEALAKRGMKVSVVELLDRVLATILDEAASRAVEAVLRRRGVEVLTGHTVQGVLGSPQHPQRVGGVVLSSGQELPCCAVVVAVGVAPNLDLVRDTGVAINRGIVVDRHMATSVPGVYACGDVAEAYDFITGANRVVPIWPNAFLGGRVAGYNMAGVPAEYPGGTVMNAFNYFGLAIVCAGLVNPPSQDGYQVLVAGDPMEGSYKKVVLQDDRVVGLLFLGDIERSGVLFGLMQAGVPIPGMQDSLLSPDFGLLSLPDSLRMQRLEQPGWRLVAAVP